MPSSQEVDGRRAPRVTRSEKGVVTGSARNAPGTPDQTSRESARARDSGHCGVDHRGNLLLEIFQAVVSIPAATDGIAQRGDDADGHCVEQGAVRHLRATKGQRDVETI